MVVKCIFPHWQDSTDGKYKKDFFPIVFTCVPFEMIIKRSNLYDLIAVKT